MRKKSPIKKRIDLKKVSKAVKPTAFNFGSAVLGGVAGALAKPAISGFGGLAIALIGYTLQKPVIASFGLGAVASVPSQLGVGSRIAPPNIEQSPTGKFSFKTEVNNGKERAKYYLRGLASKFFLDKLFASKNQEETVSGLGYLNDPGLNALDQIEQGFFASAMDSQARTGYAAHLPAAHSDLTDIARPVMEKQPLSGGVDFSYM